MSLDLLYQYKYNVGALALGLASYFLLKNRKKPAPKIYDVARVVLKGDISSGGQVTGSKVKTTLDKLLKTLPEKLIIFDIDSNGGEMEEAISIYDLIRAFNEVAMSLKKDLKIITYTRRALSGGYLLACSTDKIYTQTGAMIGSIGVYAQQTSMETFYKNFGIKMSTISVDPLKYPFADDGELKEETKKACENNLRELSDVFYEIVNNSRGDRLKYDEDITFEEITKSNVESNIKSNVKSNVESNAESNAESNVETNVESNVETNAESNVKSNVESNVETNAETNVESNAESNVESNAESNVKSNAESNAESNVETNAESNAETNVESNVESNVETNFTKIHKNPCKLSARTYIGSKALQKGLVDFICPFPRLVSCVLGTNYTPEQFFKDDIMTDFTLDEKSQTLSFDLNGVIKFIISLFKK
jgi:membrane-bound ClpP family serine protease